MHLLETEVEEIKKQQEAQNRKMKATSSRPMSRRK